MNRNRVTTTVMLVITAWAVWRIHAGAGSFGPLTLAPQSWAAAVALTAGGIVMSVLIITAASGGRRPRT